MKLRTGFMGSPDFAVPSLRATATHTDLAVVFTQPDRPAGRGQQLHESAVKQAAKELGARVEQPTKVRDGAVARLIAELALDLVVVVAYGRILPLDILHAPKYGCLNVHASLLPRWRGAAPIQRAVLAGDSHSGVCLMQMDEGLDTGAVYLTSKTEIGANETSGELFERLANLGGEVLGGFLQRFPAVEPAQPQSELGVTYAEKLRKEEGWIDWSQPATRVHDQIRGMSPWPGAMTRADGSEDAIKVFGSRVVPSGEGTRSDEVVPPGRVRVVGAEGALVACASGNVMLSQLQSPGRKRLDAQAWFAARQLPLRFH